jgi:hypothetical protein
LVDLPVRRVDLALEGGHFLPVDPIIGDIVEEKTFFERYRGGIFRKLMAIRHQFPQKTPPEYIRSSKVGPGFAGNSLIGQGDPRKGPTEDD